MSESSDRTVEGGAMIDNQPKRGWVTPTLVSVGRLGNIMQGGTSTLLPDTGNKPAGDEVIKKP